MKKKNNILDKNEIIYIAKDEKFNGSLLFEKLSMKLELYAYAIHKVIGDEFPDALKMTEEEYEEFKPTIMKYLQTEEAKDMNKKYQVEALIMITTESIQGIYQLLNGDNKKIEKSFDNYLSNMIKDIEKELR